MKVPYSKKWLPIADQLQRLADAGLEIEDHAEAEDFLRHLNYYRFSGYGLAFEAKRHRFYSGTTFGQIRQAYEFDRALRDLVYESMEVIELDVRTSVAYTFGETYQAFGHSATANFYTAIKHAGSTDAEDAFNHSISYRPSTIWFTCAISAHTMHASGTAYGQSKQICHLVRHGVPPYSPATATSLPACSSSVRYSTTALPKQPSPKIGRSTWSI